MAAPSSRTLIVLNGQRTNRGKRFWGDEDGIDSIHFDPDTTEDFSIDWSRELEAAETIDSEDVSTDGAITISAVAEASGVVTFMLSGDPGTMSAVVCEVVTSGGRTYSKTINVYGREA